MRRLLKTQYDSFVRETQADTNYRDSKFLALRTDTGEDRRAFLYFSLPNLDEANIISATLTVYLKDSWSGTTQVTLRRVTEKWKEGQITFNNQPSSTATDATTANVSSGVDQEALPIDLTAIAQYWAEQPKEVYGIRLHVDSATLKRIYSSEATDRSRRPTLAIEWGTPPDPPTHLRPNGEGKGVSAAAPLLLWESEQPYESRVQIDDTDDTFGSIVFDSNWVANTETAYDTSLDGSPPSLSDNTTYWWRVNIRDENGDASGYSEPAEFDRRSHGTLTITEPTLDNDDVETTTPLIEHTFSGRTQSEVQYELREDGVLVYERPRFPQTALSYELPPGYVRSPSSDYEVRLRVWDTLRRMTIGDDTAWVQAARVFQFAPTAGVTGVSDLTVVDQGAHLHFEWTRASAPDYFAFRADGVFEYDRLDPDDLFDSGTTYTFDYYGYKFQTAQTFAVEAVVNTAGVMKHSTTNPTVNHTSAISGIWLVDIDDGTEVLIRGQQGVGGDLGESTTVFYPLGRRDPVRVTDGVRGWEGTIQGIIAEYNGVASATFLDNLETLKGRDNANLRFVGGWRNMPIQLGEITVEPRPDYQEHYNVSIEYEQIGQYSVEVPN